MDIPLVNNDAADGRWKRIRAQELVEDLASKWWQDRVPLQRDRRCVSANLLNILIRIKSAWASDLLRVSTYSPKPVRKLKTVIGSHALNTVLLNVAQNVFTFSQNVFKFRITRIVVVSNGLYYRKLKTQLKARSNGLSSKFPSWCSPLCLLNMFSGVVEEDEKWDRQLEKDWEEMKNWGVLVSQKPNFKILLNLDRLFGYLLGFSSNYVRYKQY